MKCDVMAMACGALGRNGVRFLVVGFVFAVLASLSFAAPPVVGSPMALDAHNQTHDLSPVIAAMQATPEIDSVTFTQFGGTVTELNASQPFNVTLTAADQGYGNPVVTMSFFDGVESDANISMGFNLTQYNNATLTNTSVTNITSWYNYSYTSRIVGAGTGLDKQSVERFSGGATYYYRVELPYDPSPSGGRIFAGIVACTDTVENGTCRAGVNFWNALAVCNYCQAASAGIVTTNCSSGYYSPDCPATDTAAVYNVNPISVYGVRGANDNVPPAITNPQGTGDYEIAQGLLTSQLDYSISARDDDYDPLSYSWWLSDTDLNHTATLFQLNSTRYAGHFNLTVIVNDTYGGGDSYTWENITIQEAGSDRTWVSQPFNGSRSPVIRDGVLSMRSIMYTPARDRCEDVDRTWYGVSRYFGYESLYLFNETHWTEFNESNTDGVFDGAYTIARGANDYVWVGSRGLSSTLALYDGSDWSVVFNGSEQAGVVRDIEVADDGTVWVGTEKKGLYQYSATGELLAHYNVSNSALPENDVYSIAEDDAGDVWLAVQAENNDVYDGVDSPEDGNITGGSFTGIGVVRYNGTGWRLWNENNSGLTTNTVKAVEVDHDGVVYAGTRHGLFAYDGSAWTRVSAVPSQEIYYLQYRYWEAPDLPQDENSLLWIIMEPTSELGVIKYNGSHATTYTTASGLYQNSPSAHGIEVTGDRVWTGFTTPYTSYSQLPTATLVNPTGCVVETNRTLVVNFTATGTNISAVDHVHLRLSNTTEILYPYVPHANLSRKVNATFYFKNETLARGSYVYYDVSDSWNYTFEMWLANASDGYFSNPHSYDIVTFIMDATPPFNSIDNPQGIPADTVGPHILSPDEINFNSPPYHNYTSMSIEARPWDELMGAGACWYTFANSSMSWGSNYSLSAQNVTSHRADLLNPYFSAATQPIRFTGTDNLDSRGLIDGALYDFKLACKDVVNNTNRSNASDTVTAFQPVTFRVDNSPPYVDFTNLSSLFSGYTKNDNLILDGAQATQATIRVESAVDAISFVDACWYQLTGGNSSAARVLLGDGPVCSASCSQTLSMGGYSDAAYTLTRACNDSALEQGNSNSSAETLYVDRVAPRVAIASPAPVSTRAYNENVTADVNPTDAVTGTANCSGRIGSGSWEVLDGAGHTKLFDLTGLTEGSYTFQASCTDYANHVNDTVIQSFTVDRTDPVIDTSNTVTYITPCPAPYSVVAFIVRATDDIKMGSVQAQVTAPSSAVTSVPFQAWGADTYLGYYYIGGPGTYDTVITATDSAGNTDTFTNIQPQGVC